MRDNKTKIMIMCAIAIAINIVLGQVTSLLKLPFYLDVIGTVFIAVYFGPMYGAVTGGLTNIIWGVLTAPTSIPFALVNIVVGLVTGFIAKKYKFNLLTAIITGLILSVVAPLIGTPIGIWIHGGLTGTGFDFLFLWLQQSGSSIFASSFIAKISSNLIDKIGTCVIVYFLIEAMPKQLKPNFKRNA